PLASPTTPKGRGACGHSAARMVRNCTLFFQRNSPTVAVSRARQGPKGGRNLHGLWAILKRPRHVHETGRDPDLAADSAVAELVRVRFRTLTSSATLPERWLALARRRSPGDRTLRPGPRSGRTLLRGSHWSGRPNNHLVQRGSRLYPG